MPYTAQTRVPISRTKTDIEELLAKHGATGFAYATEGDRSLVAFSMSGRRVQIMLLMPPIDDYARTPRNARRDCGCTAVGLGASLPATLAGVAADHPGQVGGGGIGHHHAGERVPGQHFAPRRRDDGTVVGAAD